MNCSIEVQRHPSELYTPRQRWFYLIILFFVSTSNFADRNVIAVLLEPIKTEFQISDTLLGVLTGISFAILYSTLGIPVARWADRGDRKLIITLALIVWSAMTIICGFAQNFWQLAVARIGVGAGEAGAIPPAQSLIADYFPPQQRARALAFFLASATAGYLIGIVFGAKIAATYGWRTAFIVLGLPGFVLAILAYYILKEPRQLPMFHPDASQRESFQATVRVLLGKRSFIYLVIAMVIYFMIAYGAFAFFPAYMMRVLDVPLTTVGFAYGTVGAVVAVIGTISGGLVTDWLAKRNICWLAWVSALGLTLAWPAFEVMMLSPTLPTFLTFYAIGALPLYAAVPAMFATLHALCGSRRRATSVAIVFFLANLIGLGFGPILTGAMSDAFSRAFGPVGIRYALLTVMLLLLPCAWNMFLCGRYLDANVED